VIALHTDRRRRGPIKAGVPCHGRLVVAALGTILLAAAWVHHADAQEFGDIAVGRRLAETWCSSCHVIGTSPGGAVSNGAPTFTAIAGMKSTTILSLRAFLQTPHAQMPDLHLSRDEIDDLAGYILSLRSK
jgi:mono/diheme cytochrome c family protein